MNDLFLFWLSLSISGALVALTLMLLKPILIRFSKTWQYYLWLLVVLRLLIPFSPEASVVGSFFQQVQTHFAAQSETMEPVPEIHISEGMQFPAAPDSGMPNPQEPPFDIHVVSVLKNHGWGALWFSVAVLLFLRKVVGYGRFLKAVKSGSKLICDGQVPVTLQAVSAAMGIKKQIPACTNPLVRAPMLVGFIRPIIVLPSEDIPSSELTLIFKHELTHNRRMDFIYKWLAEIAVCLHWFNPFAYWVRTQINQDCEFSCDERVVACLAAAERQIYGETLLNSIVINQIGGSDIVSLSLNKDGKLIKERLNAILQYHHKPKWLVFVAAVLTSVLLCGTVFAGAYTVSAMENVQTGAAIRPIRISDKEIAPGGKISFGSQRLISGTECQILLTWTGNSKLTVICTSSSGATKSLAVESGIAATLKIEASGEYTIAVRNETAQAIGTVNGTIAFKQNTLSGQSQNSNIPTSLNTSTLQAVTYEDVEMRRYEGADGHPYIHNIKFNNTTKKILGYEYGMLAFDKDGNPLKINWWSIDKEAESTYFYLDETASEIAPSETYDVFGGWSLNFFGTDSSVEQIAYVLFCDKEITFEDGTGWANTGFDNWRSTYEGKKVDVNILNNYYPYEQEITFTKKAETDHTQEYLAWNIRYLNNAFYYGETKLRILMDVKSDQSFENFAFNEQGSLDLVIRRNSDGSIEKMGTISQEEANQILTDLSTAVPNTTQQSAQPPDTRSTSDGTKSGVEEDIQRLVINEVPANIQAAISKCDNNKWYVLESDDRQYIYYDNLPHNYAYQYEQSKNTVIVVDIGKFSDSYVLLSVPQDSDLAIHYNSTIVSYTKTAVS